MTYCFPSVNELSEKLSFELLHFIATASQNKKKISIALSGGSTPKALFERIAVNNHDHNIDSWWQYVHLYWVDERCVPTNHTDSNYGMAIKSLLSKINLSPENIHRIRGENDPYHEAVRYAEEIKQYVDLLNDIPVFDWIFLGIGEDGHTASIFPGNLGLFETTKICETVVHPVTGQFRITLAGKSLLQAKKITFLVTGESKSTVVRQIMNNEPEALSYPAGQIHLRSKNTDWYIDEEAAKYLNTAYRGKYKEG